MKSFYAMENPIRDYPWGHPSHIPRLLNIEWTQDRPVAELWMGAHPSAPSTIVDSGKTQTLNKWIEMHPDKALGTKTMKNFGRLPYLFKLIAINTALSIQTHPDKAQAEAGFARDNDAKIPLDSPNRNYKDNNHKPEIIMAITPCTILSGFCRPEIIAERIKRLCGTYGKDYFDNSILTKLEKGNTQVLSDFLYILLTMPETRRRSLIHKTASIIWDELPGKWLSILAKQHPGDSGILAPLFLNIVVLKPGEALYQPSGLLHAYLEGFGVELMANSDNVLRGGLTPKNIDVPELVNILNTNVVQPETLEAIAESGNIAWFPTPTKDFSLGTGIVTAENGETLQLSHGNGPQIVLCLEGHIELCDGHDSMNLRPGHSTFIPDSAPLITVGGMGRLAIAKPGL